MKKSRKLRSAPVNLEPLPEREPERRLVVTLLGRLVSLTAFVVTVASLVKDLAQTGIATSPQVLTLPTLLTLGVFAAIGYGILWTTSESIMGWHYGSGPALPSGLAAVVLSLCMTLPLLLVPFLYQQLFAASFLPPRFWFAVPVVIVTGAIGHLLMYGISSVGFRGLRWFILPEAVGGSIWRAIVTEVAYAVIYFTSIVLVYRLVLLQSLSIFETGILTRTVLSGMVFVTGMILFILLRYPESIDDPAWIKLRGFFAGLLISVCLCAGMFF
jgi:hypothetical protein